MDPIYLPALKCFVGDRFFYASTMTFRQVADRVVRSDQLVTSTALDDLIQRILTDRSKDIARYIRTQEQRFFNSLVLAVYEGEPEWLDVRLVEGELLPDDLDEASVERLDSKIGLLRLSGSEQIFALDGQHRVEGIKQALADEAGFGPQEISVLLVSHKAGKEGKERTRRLFTTLNRYARPVSKYEKVALDEDDALAIITRRLLNDHPFLCGARTSYSKSAAIPSSDKISLTTLPIVYDTAVSLIKGRSLGGETWTIGRIAYPRPPDAAIAALVDQVSEFWTQLGAWAPEFKAAAELSDEARKVTHLRSKAGGSATFRPVLHLALARVIRRWIDKGESIGSAFTKLANVPRELTADQWARVIWDPVGKKMIATSNAQNVATGLLLTWSGYSPIKSDLLANYRSLVGDEAANLPTI